MIGSEKDTEHLMQVIELIVKRLRFENLVPFTIRTVLAAKAVLLFSGLQFDSAMQAALTSRSLTGSWFIRAS